MGKSDSLIFEEYKKITTGIIPASTAFLGFSGENDFTRSISGKHDFFDLSLKNWEINSEWVLPQKYDFVVSTRCPYFSRNPLDFINRCKQSLNPSGKIFIDWSLGDQWRFKEFKVGWVRNGEHEFAYTSDNFLHSCLWRDEFELNDDVKLFAQNVLGKFGYAKSESLSSIVRKEVPQIINYEFEKISFKFLWPDAPQIYIMTLL